MIRNALALAIFTLQVLGSPAQAAAGFCSSIFDGEALEINLLKELSGLRADIERLRLQNQQDVARILYQTYQKRLSDARTLGLDPANFEARLVEKVAQANAAHDEEQAHLARVRRESETDIRTWHEVENETILIRGLRPIMSPDGRKSLSVSERGIVALHSSDGAELREFEGESNRIYQALINWKSKLVVLRTTKRENHQVPVVEVFDLETGLRKYAVDGSEAMLSTDGKTLAARTSNTIYVYEAETGRELMNRLDPLGPSMTERFKISGDGKQISVSSHDSAFVINVSKRSDTRLSSPGKRAPIALFPTDDRVAYLTNGKLIIHPREQSYRKVEMRDPPKNLSKLDFSEDGKYLIGVEDHRTVHFWSVATGERVKSFTSGQNILDVEFNETSLKVFTRSSERDSQDSITYRAL